VGVTVPIRGGSCRGCVVGNGEYLWDPDVPIGLVEVSAVSSVAVGGTGGSVQEVVVAGEYVVLGDEACIAVERGLSDRNFGLSWTRPTLSVARC
jgi:hypothetical protein